MFFLTTRPLWISAVLLLAFGTTLSMCGPVLVRRRITLSRLSTNNEVAGFKYAVIGTLYAVMLAFTVIVVWEKFNDAASEVAREAGVAVNIYRLSDSFGPERGPALRARMSAYLRAALDQDWPAMQAGDGSRAASNALDALYSLALSFQPRDTRDSVVLAQVLHELEELTEARRARIVLAAGIIPTVVWLVLFAGAALTIGFTFFFGTQNLRAQTMMTGMLAFLIFSALLVAIAIDRPFSGTVRVHPDALVEALGEFGG